MHALRGTKGRVSRPLHGNRNARATLPSFGQVHAELLSASTPVSRVQSPRRSLSAIPTQRRRRRGAVRQRRKYALRAAAAVTSTARAAPGKLGARAATVAGRRSTKRLLIRCAAVRFAACRRSKQICCSGPQSSGPNLRALRISMRRRASVASTSRCTVLCSVHLRSLNCPAVTPCEEPLVLMSYHGVSHSSAPHHAPAPHGGAEACTALASAGDGALYAGVAASPLAGTRRHHGACRRSRGARARAGVSERGQAAERPRQREKKSPAGGVLPETDRHSGVLDRS